MSPIQKVTLVSSSQRYLCTSWATIPSTAQSRTASRVCLTPLMDMQRVPSIKLPSSVRCWIWSRIGMPSVSQLCDGSDGWGEHSFGVNLAVQHHASYAIYRPPTQRMRLCSSSLSHSTSAATTCTCTGDWLEFVQISKNTYEQQFSLDRKPES